ncbi:MAG: GNAT family N-acetyltransferase, partial [Bacteroidota bacterium]
HIRDLFQKDPNPFIAEEYKHKEKFEEYVFQYVHYRRHTPKHGAHDWLIKTTDGTYIGLLNVYDLTLEDWNDNHRKCTLGFQTAEAFRRNYFTMEAVSHLAQYLFTEMNMLRLLAFTVKDNFPAMEMLKNMGWAENTEAYHYKERYNYFELHSIQAD